MDKEVSHCRNFVTLCNKPNSIHFFTPTHTHTSTREPCNTRKHRFAKAASQDILSHAARTPSSHPVRCWWGGGGFGRGISLSSSHHAVRLSDQWLTIVPGLQPQQGLWITYWQSCVYAAEQNTHTHKKPHSCVGSAGENKRRSDPPSVTVIICYPSYTSLSLLRETKRRWPLNPRSLWL